MEHQAGSDQLLEVARQHFREGRFDQAASLYRSVLTQQPRSAEIWRGLGDALAGDNRLDEAIAVYGQALAIQPTDAGTCNNLGIALKTAGRLNDAIDAFRRAVSIDPRGYHQRCNLGNALMAVDQLDESFTQLQQAIALEPNISEIHNNLGAVLELQGRFEDAIAEYHHAVRMDPENASAHYNFGLELLRQGDFEQGWRECEWRWQMKSYHPDRRSFSQPRWSGDPLQSRRLLIHAEQGLGDTIQFARYLPLLKRKFGGEIILALHTALQPLFAGIDGVDRFWTDSARPDFEVHCPLLSLPMAFQTTLQTIPPPEPRLSADPKLAAMWRDRVESHSAPMRVGLAWAGTAAHPRDRLRSLPLAALTPLGKIPDVCFFSLQKGPAAEQVGSSPPGMRIIDCTSDIENFADTAALVANLDLVICVDTAVAHLAGAMGKPVWVLLPFVPDWRWMLHRSDTPWYPTMKLFRQPKPGDWETPIREIAQELSSIEPGHSRINLTKSE